MIPLVIAFDVDGTLINLDDTPRYEVISILKTLQAAGHRIIVWSGGGIDYAQMWCRRLGILAEVVAKFSIAVDLAFDDMADGIDTSKQLHAKVIVKI